MRKFQSVRGPANEYEPRKIVTNCDIESVDNISNSDSERSSDLLDSDVLSISTSSLPRELTLPDNEWMTQACQEAINCLVAEYKETSPGQPPASSGQTTIYPQVANQSKESSNNPNKPRGQKRRNSEQGDENAEDDDKGKRPKKRAKDKSATDGPLLACPYWKRCPAKHSKCFFKILRRVRDVKQHLYRSHTIQFYCPKCLTEFKNHSSQEAHFGENCVRNRSIRLNGITLDLQAKLNKRSPANCSHQEQWFYMWDILFPGHQRPRSAYMDSTLSENVNRREKST